MYLKQLKQLCVTSHVCVCMQDGQMCVVKAMNTNNMNKRAEEEVNHHSVNLCAPSYDCILQQHTTV